MRAEIPKVDSFNSQYSERYENKTPGFNANKNKSKFWKNGGFDQAKEVVYN
jgi:conjugal transfer/entry exclusion protein